MDKMTKPKMTVDALIDRYGAEKIARTQVARVHAGWKARLTLDPDNELLQAIVFLLDHEE
jgi:hypothetical protein